ncbi:uncharacterized protein LOC143461690 isoform X2 [Clavelina lepadiformis]|uniref:uncharacterized protein LOC143461690 isoform X2 n=1 Tax=Clavelina lepadiformis TaxID=159417 RepID=UPI004042E192
MWIRLIIIIAIAIFDSKWVSGWIYTDKLHRLKNCVEPNRDFCVWAPSVGEDGFVLGHYVTTARKQPDIKMLLANGTENGLIVRGTMSKILDIENDQLMQINCPEGYRAMGTIFVKNNQLVKPGCVSNIRLMKAHVVIQESMLSQDYKLLHVVGTGLSYVFKNGADETHVYELDTSRTDDAGESSVEKIKKKSTTNVLVIVLAVLGSIVVMVGIMAILYFAFLKQMSDSSAHLTSTEQTNDPLYEMATQVGENRSTENESSHIYSEVL